MRVSQYRQVSIAIFGSYGGGSIGDSLILMGLISSFSRLLPSGATICVYHFGHESPLKVQDLEALAVDREVIVSTKTISPARWKGYIGRLLIRALPFKASARRSLLARLFVRLEKIEEDYWIIGGGNLVMDLYDVWPFCLKRVVDACEAQGRPYSLLGIGAGPINSDYAAGLFRGILGAAQCVEFRDFKSLELCKSELDYHGGRVMPDPAFALHLNEMALPRRARKAQLGVNVAGVWGDSWPYKNHSRYREMLLSYSGLISKLCKQCDYTRVVFIVSNLVDVKAAEDLAALIAIISPALSLGYSDYDGLRSLEVLSAAYRSARKGRMVHLPLEC